MLKRNILFGVLLVCLLSFGPSSVYGCSAKGPADPVTGLISYPPGAGNGEAITKVPVAGLEGTPFEDKKYYKGWANDAMKLIVVPAGTTLAFEGVLEGAAGGVAPPYWEEGKVRGVGGTTVSAAAPPTWTISGNGGGDYRDGAFPPSAYGLQFVNFEAPPSAIIAADTPNEKATWHLTYDRDTAVRALLTIWQDPVIRALYLDTNANLPADFDMDAIAAAAKDPQGDDGAKSLNDFKISRDPNGVDALRETLDATLTQRAGMVLQTGAVITRKFLDADNVEFTVDKAEDTRVIVKAGYIAMQGAGASDYYPTGRYDTKFYITPPSSTQYEVAESKLALNFSTPTSPDYWVIDLNSGLESARDCVWCWIEVEAELKPEGTKITDQTDEKNFYDIRPNSYAVGGVFVRGIYSSGASSVGRNTMVYVVVADTERPAHYEWESTEVKGKTGETLAQTGNLKFRVFDNNPVIGSNGNHNNIFDVFPDLDGFEFVESNKRPQNLDDNPDVYLRYLEPVKGGFNIKNLLPTLHYNVCVPAYAGFKVAGDARTYTGPLPLVNDVLVLPLQKFLWKSTETDDVQVSDFQIYHESGADAANLGILRDEGKWKGYSSYLVTVKADALSEPMGTGLADNSLGCTLSIADDLKAVAPVKKLLSEGIPVDETKVHYFGWSKALKMFVSASDGIVVRSSYPDGDINTFSSNRSPSFSGASSISKLLANKFSGADIAFPAATADFVYTVQAPANVDKLAKLDIDQLVKGGSLGGCALPPGVSAPDNAWGKFNYVTSLLDTCRPNIALEVVNSKNEKAAVFGNLYAMGENDNLAKAVEGAGTDAWAHAPDSNVDDKTFLTTSLFYDDTAWEFKDDIENDLYLAMKNSMDEGTFKPWLFAFPATDQNKLWKTGYWNGSDAFNNKKMAFQQGSRDRLVFRYWAFDNINPCNVSAANPNGLKADSGAARARFKSVSGFVTSEVKLTDVPGYQGEVAVDKVWWPDYIFHNPSGGSSEECSISLKAEDEKNNTRTMKLWFRIIPPSRELIRTIEDRRNREN